MVGLVPISFVKDLELEGELGLGHSLAQEDSSFAPPSPHTQAAKEANARPREPGS